MTLDNLTPHQAQGVQRYLKQKMLLDIKYSGERMSQSVYFNEWFDLLDPLLELDLPSEVIDSLHLEHWLDYR